MRSPLEHPADETRRLRGCINDLTSLLALSSIESDRESHHAIRALLPTLVSMLKLDFAYAHILDDGLDGAEELLRLGEPQESYASEEDFAAIASAFLDRAPSNDTSRQPIGRETISIVRLALGTAEKTSHLVVGCRRLDFPDATERLILNVAAQQATIGLQGARLLNEQKRLADNLLRDATAERHNAEEALSKLRSELTHMARVSGLGALTASIAHEVNQPLSGIVTNTSTGLRMLSADPPNVSGALETLRRTARDATRASDVIARLRAMFSRRDTTRERVHLNEAAQEVVALSLSELERHRLSLHTQYARDLPTICGDRIQLQQVILNLLLNASDAMKDAADCAREILVRTELQHDGAVRLTVVDSGTGIDPEHAEKLFEPFFTTKSTGMGIGLAVSRSIIEWHGGQLWAEPNQGHGATFCFSIPLPQE